MFEKRSEFPEWSNPDFVGDDVSVWVRGRIDPCPDFGKMIGVLDASLGCMEKVVEIAGNLAGQFAMVLSFEKKGLCYLIADAIGAEPLYYLPNGGEQFWAFRIRDLLSGLSNRCVDPKGLDESMLYRWLNEQDTMVDGVKRVNPGEIVELSKFGVRKKLIYSTLRYKAKEMGESELALIDRTSRALDEYFRRLRISFSRVAVFLSGGVDSSLLLAKAREHSFDNLIAITFEFSGGRNPELARARRVADQLGVSLRVVEISDEYVVDNLPKIVELIESPNGYFNCLARLKMMESISHEVEAIIIGEGADGMFSMEVGGGTRALRFERKRRVLKQIPKVLQNGLSRLLVGARNPRVARFRMLLNTDALTYLRTQGEVFPDLEISGAGDATPIERLIPCLTSLRAGRKSYFYARYEPRLTQEFSEDFVVEFCQNRGLYTQNRHQYLCYSTLCSEMGLKLSAPFLSRDVMEIGLNLPSRFRSDSRGAKPILKKLACRYVSEDIVYAEKLGFETPLADWLGRSRGYWEGILKSERARVHKLINLDAIDDLDPGRDSPVILSLLMLELFMCRFIDG